jgi:hypothetical protein
MGDHISCSKQDIARPRPPVPDLRNSVIFLRGSKSLAVAVLSFLVLKHLLLRLFGGTLEIPYIRSDCANAFVTAGHFFHELHKASMLLTPSTAVTAWPQVLQQNGFGCLPGFLP